MSKFLETYGEELIVIETLCPVQEGFFSGIKKILIKIIEAIKSFFKKLFSFILKGIRKIISLFKSKKEKNNLNESAFTIKHPEFAGVDLPIGKDSLIYLENEDYITDYEQIEEVIEYEKNHFSQYIDLFSKNYENYKNNLISRDELYNLLKNNKLENKPNILIINFRKDSKEYTFPAKYGPFDRHEETSDKKILDSLYNYEIYVKKMENLLNNNLFKIIENKIMNLKNIVSENDDAFNRWISHETEQYLSFFKSALRFHPFFNRLTILLGGFKYWIDNGYD